jgi:hypothetical protein
MGERKHYTFTAKAAVRGARKPMHRISFDAALLYDENKCVGVGFIELIGGGTPAIPVGTLDLKTSPRDPDAVRDKIRELMIKALTVPLRCPTTKIVLSEEQWEQQ